jgi:flagellar protein FliO/FliZ
MSTRRYIACLLGSLVHAAGVIGAEVPASSRQFAAPDIATSAPAGSAAGIGQVTLALLLVLIAVFVVAVLLKRFRMMAGGGSGSIEVLAQAALGQRERAVVVRVGETRLLLGVAAGQVTLLHTLPPDAVLSPGQSAATAGDRSTFSSLLKKSLGR